MQPFTREQAEMSMAIERIKIHFDFDATCPMARDNRIPKMRELMTVGQLERLEAKLGNMSQPQKLQAVIDAIIDARDALGKAGLHKYEVLNALS